MYYITKKKLRELSQQNTYVKSIYRKLNTIKTNGMAFINDEVFAQIKYKENTGKTLNLNDPQYFNEKLWWLKINYRTPLMTQCSDKVLVRDYISQIGLKSLLNDVQGVYDQFDEIPFEELRGKFFIKCNHVSGINTIYDSNNKSEFNFKSSSNYFNQALKMNYYYQSREWNYKNIKPKIIVEKFIESHSTLLDYRFLCFHGEVKLIFVDINTASKSGEHNPYAKRNVYDRNFVLQDFSVGREGFDPKLVEKPEELSLMIQYAEKIAAPFTFCRVDLYNTRGEIKFGEITFYPGGATQQFSSREKELEVGGWINLNKT